MRRSVRALLVVSLALAAIAVPVGASVGPAPRPAATDGEAVVVEVELSGTTATGVTVENATHVRQQVAADLGVAVDRVTVRSQNGSAAVEVQTAGISSAELTDALAAAGISVDQSSVRRGLTRTSQQRAAAIVHGRLQAMQGYNGSVLRVESQRLYVRVTPDPSAAALDRLTQRGEVTLYAQTPDGERTAVVTNRDVRRVQPVRVGTNISLVPFQLTPAGVDQFTTSLERLNFTGAGVNACEGDPAQNATGYCLLTSLNGDVLTSADMTEPLANSIEMGVFTKKQWVGFITDTAENARAVRLAVLSIPVPAATNVVSVQPASDVSVESNWSPESGIQPDADDDTTTPDGGDSTATPKNDTATTAPGGSGPGFTPVVAAVALVGAGLLAARRT